MHIEQEELEEEDEEEISTLCLTSPSQRIRFIVINKYCLFPLLLIPVS